MEIAFIILNYGDPSATLKLVEQIHNFSQDYKKAVVVVDNFSNDRNLEKLKLASGDNFFCVALNENNGYGVGNNAGLTFAFSELKVDACIILNNDITIKELNLNEIEKQVDSFKNTHCLFTGHVYEHGYQISLNVFNALTFTSKNWDNYISDIDKPIYPTGCCWGINKDMWLSNHGFTTDHFLYFEELEYIYRYKKKYKTFPQCYILDGLDIQHFQGGVTGISKNVKTRSAISEYYSARARILFARKNRSFLFQGVVYNLLLVANRFFKLEFSKSFLIIKATYNGLFK